MAISDVYKICLSIISSLGGASLIVLAFSSWLGKVWASRLLETEKKKFTAELELLKTNNQNFINAVSVSNSLYLESQRSFANERINAIKELWNAISDINKHLPSAITILDVFGFEEYVNFFNNPKNTSIAQSVSDEFVLKIIKDDVNKLRPFIDEKSFAYFWCYRALVGRLSYYIKQLIQNNNVSGPWQREKGVVEILKPIFNEQELTSLKDEKWSTRTLLGYIETKLCDHLRLLASGEKISKESLSHSMAINKAAESLKEIEENEKQ